MTNLVLNGQAIYSVASIADNYNEAELAKAFKTGVLADWLKKNGEKDILQSVRKIKGDSENVASALIKALGLNPQLCSKAEKKAKAEEAEHAKRKEEARKAKEEEERKAKEEEERQEKKSTFKDARTIIEDALRPLLFDENFYLGCIPLGKLKNACHNMFLAEPYGNVVAIYWCGYDYGPPHPVIVTKKGAYFYDVENEFDFGKCYVDIVWGQNTCFEKGVDESDIIVGNRKITLRGLDKAGQEILVKGLRLIDTELAHYDTTCQGDNQLKQLIVDEFSKISSDRIAVGESLSRCRKHTAIHSMGALEDVIVVVDDTAKARDAEEGIAITDMAIYCKTNRKSKYTEMYRWGNRIKKVNSDYYSFRINGEYCGLGNVGSETRKSIENATIKINDFVKAGGHT